MPVVVPPTFVLPLGPDLGLLLRGPALTDAYHELVLANRARLARWEPWASRPLTPERTRAELEAGLRGWVEGTALPTVLATPCDGGWLLVGSIGLRIESATRSGEAGYWVDGSSEGRGYARRGLVGLLGQAFGPLHLDRVEIRTDVANLRSRALAERLGFRRERLEPHAMEIDGQWRDDVVYGLSASAWSTRPET